MMRRPWLITALLNVAAQMLLASTPTGAPNTTPAGRHRHGRGHGKQSPSRGGVRRQQRAAIHRANRLRHKRACRGRA